jgi:hypothetical protein
MTVHPAEVVGLILSVATFLSVVLETVVITTLVRRTLVRWSLINAALAALTVVSAVMTNDPWRIVMFGVLGGFMIWSMVTARRSDAMPPAHASSPNNPR